MREPFDSERIVQPAYRPFFLTWLYRSELFIDRPGAIDAMFPVGASNRAICFSGAGARASYMSLAVERPADLHFGASVDGYQQVSRYVFEESDRRADNITDWGLDQFKKHYTPGREKAKRKVTKDAIFHYVYGVLHDPVYREKYALNLKREFPRIPFYPDFWAWVVWGEELMNLHIGYEKVTPAKLKRTDTVDEKLKDTGTSPKVILKADKEAGWAGSSSTARRRSRESPPSRGSTSSATAAHWSGSSISTKKRSRRTRPSGRNSTPTASPTTRRRSSTFSAASPPSACARWKSRGRWRRPRGKS